MHPSANTAGGRRVTRWSRESIIEKLREWNELYGEPPCSADWNPSLARWRAQEWRAGRYREGIRASTNAAERAFCGSVAPRAAGGGAPFRRLVRRGRARGGPGAPPARAAPPPARRGAPVRGAAGPANLRAA